MNTRLLLLLALCASARAEVLVVDQAGGGDFTKISDAVAAATEGDTILVRPILPFGEYGVLIVDGKSLTIVGDPSGVDVGQIQVRSLSSGQQVVLRGFDSEIYLENNAGSVWIEDCTGSGMYGIGTGFISCQFVAAAPGGPGLHVEQCASVTVVRSALGGGEGGNGATPGGMSFFVATDGGPGLRAISSQVSLHGCLLLGGAGGGGAVVCGFSGEGGDAVDAADSLILLAGCEAYAGLPGNGGPGSALSADAGSLLHLLDNEIDGSVDAPVLALTGSARSFELPSPLREGEAGTLEIAGEPGELVAFFWSFLGASLPLPGKGGWLLLSPTFLAGPFVVGTISDPEGALSLPFVAPDLSIGLESQTFLLQGFFHDGSSLRLGPGTAFVLVDQAF